MTRRYNPMRDWRYWCFTSAFVFCVNVALGFMRWSLFARCAAAFMVAGVGACLISRHFLLRHGEWHGYPWPKWLIKR